MLGRVRASPVSSLELLEMERPPSKIIKHDSLSIYESTLLKLKQGSHFNSRSSPSYSAQVDAYCAVATGSPEEAMTDADCSSTDSFPDSSSSFQSTGSSKEQETKNMSILYLFSKYKISKHAQNSNNDKDVMVIETGFCSSSSVSPTSGS